MDKRLKQLVQLAEDGNEEAASDIAREFPDQFEKIFGIPMPKLVKPKKFNGGGEVITNKKPQQDEKKSKGKPQGVGKAIKGYGRAYMS